MSSGYTDDAKWLYTFDRANQYACMVIRCRLNDPVRLSIGTFEPYNKWIWRFSPDVRENKKSYKNNFKTTLDVENMTSISGFSLFLDSRYRSVPSHPGIIILQILYR